MTKVLIVEDSPVMQELLAYTIKRDSSLNIIGIADDGEKALEILNREQPDVIAMDWQMPNLNGLLTTQKIMETNPIPVVIVTGSVAANDVAITFSLMEAGAVAIVKKPHGIGHPDYYEDAQKLNETLRLMSEVKLVKRIAKRNTPTEVRSIASENIIEKKSVEIVLIGASTGGPQILQKILLGLSGRINVPILIVQHITKGFSKGFAEWLSKSTNIPTEIASQELQLMPGHAYIAPDNYQMGVSKGPKIFLKMTEPEHGMRPSVSYLFRSAAENLGANAVGILLSGMGTDGSMELKLMRNKGAITIAQNKESSIVHGMPGEAIKLDAAKYVLSPDEIINVLNVLLKK